MRATPPSESIARGGWYWGRGGERGSTMTDRDGWLGMARGGSGMWMAADGNGSSARVAARREEDLARASNPQVPAFWARAGGGHPILLWIAAAHAAAGLFGATAGAL